METWYQVVMNSDENPLHVLAPAQRFQIMVFLSLMWTTIFCSAAGAWIWYGEFLIGHMLICLGVLLAGATFHKAKLICSYCDFPVKDGTARYDDVWGRSIQS